MLHLSVLFGVLVVCHAKFRNYDNFDMEALLSNSNKSKAFIDESKCINETDREMKHDLVEIVSTSCANCTVKEKKKFADAMMALRRSMDDSQVIAMFISKMTNMFQGGMESDRDKRI